MKSSTNYKRGAMTAKIVTTMILALILSVGNELIAQPNGETLFKTNCASCHFASNKKSTGPGLAGLTKRRSAEWILKWVANSNELIASGDADAVAIYAEYNKMPMPPFAMPEEDVKAIMTYLEQTEAKLAEKAKADSLAKIEAAKNAPPVKKTER